MSSDQKDLYVQRLISFINKLNEHSENCKKVVQEIEANKQKRKKALDIIRKNMEKRNGKESR